MLRGVATTLTALSFASIALGQTTPCGSPGPDIIVGEMADIQNYTASGTLEALSIGTTSCNVGSQNIQWNACGSLTHPVIGGSLYRFNTVGGSTRFEQLGQSWLKNAFTALTG